MKNRKILATALLTLCTISATAHASDESSRMRHRIVLTYGLNSDPFGAMGFALGYNFTSFLRATAGYSSLLNASFIGGGLKFFMPQWNLSPYATVGYSSTSATGSFSLGSQTVTSSVGALYYGAGLEWQTGYGLTLAVGEQTATGPYSSIGFLPSFYLGWAF